MIRIDVFSDYGLVNTWWDECVNLKLINDNSVELNDDFLVMKNDENFIICSCGHNIFEFKLQNSYERFKHYFANEFQFLT